MPRIIEFLSSWILLSLSGSRFTAERIRSSGMILNHLYLTGESMRASTDNHQVLLSDTRPTSITFIEHIRRT
jgi:hypothetical protein